MRYAPAHLCRQRLGAVFFVDDNFIGDKPKLKREILTAITPGQNNYRHKDCGTESADMNQRTEYVEKLSVKIADWDVQIERLKNTAESA
jgi:hypothetical protein